MIGDQHPAADSFQDQFPDLGDAFQFIDQLLVSFHQERPAKGDPSDPPAPLANSGLHVGGNPVSGQLLQEGDHLILCHPPFPGPFHGFRANPVHQKVIPAGIVGKASELPPLIQRKKGRDQHLEIGLDHPDLLRRFPANRRGERGSIAREFPGRRRQARSIPGGTAASASAVPTLPSGSALHPFRPATPILPAGWKPRPILRCDALPSTAPTRPNPAGLPAGETGSDRTTAGSLSSQERDSQDSSGRNPPPELPRVPEPTHQAGEVPHQPDRSRLLPPAQGVSPGSPSHSPNSAANFFHQRRCIPPSRVKGNPLPVTQHQKMKKSVPHPAAAVPGSGCDPSPAAAKGGPFCSRPARRCAPPGDTNTPSPPTSGEDRREIPIGEGGPAPSGTGPGKGEGRFPIPAACFPYTPLPPRGTGRNASLPCSAESIRSRKERRWTGSVKRLASISGSASLSP